MRVKTPNVLRWANESSNRPYLAGMSGPRVTIIVLAAGRSTRFGNGNKLTAMLDGIPVIRRVADAAIASGVSEVVVVTNDAAIRESLAGLGIRFVPFGGDAMGSSIAAGVAASSDADAWLIWPGDMPLVRPATAARVAAAFNPDAPVVPTFGGRRGHPVLFPGRLRSRLTALSQDRGARSVLTDAGSVIEVTVDDPDILFDIDSPSDLEAAARLVR